MVWTPKPDGGWFDDVWRSRVEMPDWRPDAALVDMDGTLVCVSAIRYMVATPGCEKDFDAFHEASRHAPAIEQALEFCRRHHAAGHEIVVGTARMCQHYDVSLGWLFDKMVTPFDGPIMPRQFGDTRSDVVIKRKMHRYLSRNYNIVAACDDNPPILNLWEELGIPEIEVVPGWDDELIPGPAVMANIPAVPGAGTRNLL